MQEAATFGELLLRLRTRAGRTQEKQAEVINAVSGRDTMSRREISRYENNENIPTNHTVAHIAITFGLSPEQLQKHASAARAQRRNGGDGAGPGQRENEDAGRAALGHTVPLAGLPGSGGVSPCELHGAVTAAARDSLRFAEFITPSNVDTDTLSYLSDALADIAAQYVHAPVRPLFVSLVAVRDEVFGLLKGRQKPQESRSLYFLAGTCCLLLAHASQNLGDQRSALAQIRTAGACAQQADHQGLRAWIGGTAALIAEWSPRHHRALEYVEEAAELASAGQSRIRVIAIEARTAARSGDHQRATAALARLQDAQEETPGDDGLGEFGGILTFPAAKQDYYVGATYALLGNHAEAERYATRAIATYSNGPREERSYGDEALAVVDVITARLALGDIETAGTLLHRVLSLHPEQRIQQLGNALGRVTEALHQPRLRSNRAARELTELTRDFRLLDGSAALTSIQ
ncbi:helix-turn-helix domain-containing protein [Streptomyces uncialis]|uniref:helix-turn-helix domain-containing protein n=1 Tax=Streptomyces uncialis TaxID=1048205 RepID=UPI0022591130|nr:helix-turn-helix transcriptional regulator [Streptomyces uncialis]MCX4664510.1 helix-turn-helix domain-containing protein [Streptomyces uncialis]